MHHVRNFLQNLVFEPVLFARQIKNLHETKNRFRKCFLENFYKKKYRKYFSDKKVQTSAIFGQLFLFALRFRKLRCQGTLVPNYNSNNNMESGKILDRGKVITPLPLLITMKYSMPNMFKLRISS